MELTGLIRHIEMSRTRSIIVDRSLSAEYPGHVRTITIKHDNIVKIERDNGPGPLTAITYIFTYDCQIQETNSLGEVVKERRYNAANQPVAENDGMGNETEFTYLPDGQMESVSRGNRSQSYKYNARGQI